MTVTRLPRASRQVPPTVLTTWTSPTSAVPVNWRTAKAVSPPVRPRFHLHFTPTSSSWLNLVGRWFAEQVSRMLVAAMSAWTNLARFVPQAGQSA